jgi:hypothetical protein
VKNISLRINDSKTLKPIYIYNMSWKQVLDFYQYNCNNNSDFLMKFNNIPFKLIENYSNPYGNIIKNMDMILSNNQIDELTLMYLNNNLIAFRPGNVESSFAISYVFDIKIPNSHLNIDNNSELDKKIRSNAGLYYKDSTRRIEVLNWWSEHFIDLIKKSTFCSCYCFLEYDLVLLSLLNIKSKFYDYSYLYQVILQNSEGKKILYIGNAVESIKAGYERGLQNVWKFHVSNFSMYYLKTPQTTTGMEYPHDSMIETSNDIIRKIDDNYCDFDTAIFGCGAYGAPLINILRKKYPQKNLIYLGSDCFKMFGVKINLQPWELYDSNVNKNAVIDIVESLPDGCINHPEKKYWRL